MFKLQTLATLLLLSSTSEAFTVTPPPANLATPVVAVSEQQVGIASPLATASVLPSQRDLLKRADSTLSTLSVSTTTAAPAVQATSSPGVFIADINYDGKVPKTESDEYVVVTNGSKNPVDVSGYYIYVATSGTQGATFTFPKDSIIKPNSSVRIYTNEIHKETGGYSFGSGKAVWNNKAGLAVFKDANGTKLGEFKYKAPTAAS